MDPARPFGADRRTTPRVLAWGAGAAGLYLAALWSLGAWLAPVRLLYDGYTPPPPYRWVHPPLALLQHNQPPQSGAGVIALTTWGSAPGSVDTGDNQAAVVLPKGAIAPRPGEPSVEVRIAPLDPGTIAPAPKGLRYDANAYRIDATYTVSHRPAVLQGPVSVVLRYATGATALLHLTRTTWTALPSQQIPITFQIYGPTRTLGVFAAAGPPQSRTPISAWLYRGVTVALWIAVAVVLVALLRDYLRSRRRRGGTR